MCEVIVDGKQLDGVECKEGDYVGELALLSKDSKRTATVRAKNDVTCLACSADTFKTVIKGSVTWKKRGKQRKAVGVKRKKKKKKKGKKAAAAPKEDALSPEEIQFLIGSIS